MKIIKMYLFFLLVLFAAHLFAQTEKNILGEWYTNDNKSIVKFERDLSGTINGTVTWISDKVENDKAKKLEGKTIVTDLTYSEKENKYKGKFYIPQMDKTKDAEFEIKDNTILHIKVNGGLFFSKTVEWTRKEGE